MNLKGQIALCIGLAIAVVIGLVWQLYPLPDAQKRLDRIPFYGPKFESRDLMLSEFEENFFKNVNVLKRLYLIDNTIYFVTILDGTHNRHVVHDPYYCFRGSGWDIIKEEKYPLPKGNANLVEIVKGNQKKSAIYWFSDGATAFNSPYEYWWKATLRRLTLGKSGKEPVLIMIQPLNDTINVEWPKILSTLHFLEFA